MEGESNTTKPKEGVELKGGHEPAKIVGGRRIVTRERHSESEDKTTPKKPTEQAEEEEEEFGEDKPAKQASVSVITVHCFHSKYFNYMVKTLILAVPPSNNILYS